MLKISVVTPILNCRDLVCDCLESVEQQDHTEIEHIIVDGGSTDGTVDRVIGNKRSAGTVISERDEGIYDALKKGFAVAKGDVVGILHSDDRFYDSHTLSLVASAFYDGAVDYVYGDILMVRKSGRVGRYWRSGELKGGKITRTQLPHPSIFLSKQLVNRITPVFDASYEIAADLKQQLIFANQLEARGRYLNKPLVRMRLGGTSTKSAFAYYRGWRESARAWNEVNGKGGWVYVFKKLASKVKGIRG